MPVAIRPLPLALVPGDRETPVDYLSRLSFRNGRDGLRKIATDFGIGLTSLTKGDPEQVERAARLGSADPSLLMRSAFIPTGDRGRTIYRGQIFHPLMTTHQRIRFCAACLSGDVSHGTGRIESRPWRRAEWLLSDVANCPDHSLALTVLGPSAVPERTVFDFSASVAGILPRLGHDLLQAEVRPVTSMEGHILRRLSGCPAPSEGEAWLDRFPLYAVIRLCEVVGAVALEGVDAPYLKTRDATSRNRQAAGFEVAAGGPSAFRDFLSDLRRLDHDPRGQRGPQAIFGRLYKWLSHAPRDPAYDPMRHILRDLCLDTMPLGAGEAPPFGSPLPTRRLHSIRSASLEYGVPPVGLRKILFARGIARSEQFHLSDDRVTFGADANDSFLRDLAAALTQEAAARYLGLPVDVVKSFIHEGVLVPWLGGNKKESVKYHFRTADLDDFVERLSAGHVPALKDHPSLHDIPTASKRACRSQSEIARLLLSGDLDRVGRREGATGYRSVLVDPAEVRAKSRPAVDQGVSVPDARDETGIVCHVLTAMTRHGILAFRMGKNPVTGGAQTYLDRDDLAEFVKRYAPLAKIASELSASPKLVRNRLADIEVEPAAFSRDVGAVFYERDRLPPLQTLDLTPKTRKPS